MLEFWYDAPDCLQMHMLFRYVDLNLIEIFHCDVTYVWRCTYVIMLNFQNYLFLLVLTPELEIQLIIKMHFCQIFSVSEPVTYVFLQGPKTSTLGPLLPWSEKKSGLTQKSYKFFVCSFAMASINLPLSFEPISGYH